MEFHCIRVRGAHATKGENVMTEGTNMEKMLTNREPIQAFWQIRRERDKNALEKNNFGGFVDDSA